VRPAVSGLEKEFPGKVVARNIDATTATARKDIKELGFENHGLVIRSAKGEVLFKQPDHEVKIDDVRKELNALFK
jgi:DeoR/GlpR family transcriptional regulator of sugar metabolism